MDIFFTEKKIENRIREIKEYSYRDRLELPVLYGREDESYETAPLLPEDFEGWREYHMGDRWEGRDKYLWLGAEIEIPEGYRDKQILGMFDFGKTGEGGNSGFESLLYLNGRPYQGVDSNHREVFIPREYAGKSVRLLFRLWSGLEGGGIPAVQKHEIKCAFLSWLDEKADDLYFLSAMTLETVRTMDDNDPKRHILLGALNEAFLRVDWSCPGSGAFYRSLHEADDLLAERTDSMDKHQEVTVSCIGHTHIDVAWLWRLRHTREKAARSFSTVLRLMERYPDYIFLHTTPQVYEFVKQDFPELYEKIKERIKEGRWEVNGAMWVEADCNLTSGESLTRQILLGRRFVKEEFGKDMTYLWLPDVFGYSWALPQILKKSGIDMFMTTKISWNQYNRMPYDTFRWKGMDGSEVLTHFITTPHPDKMNDPKSYFYTYNGTLRPSIVKGVWNSYSEKRINRELLISYGYGDGGGGVNREELEQRRRLDRIDGLPNVGTSTADDYFNRLKSTFESTKEFVHTWDGELYLEYHRGTYTSQAYNKKMNRRMELLYREAEWLNAVALVTGNGYKEKQDELTEGWKIILRNQFHDIIPGSSIREVYEDSKEEYAQAEAIARTVESEALKVLADSRGREPGNPETYTLINNSNFQRTGIVKIPRKNKRDYSQGQFRDSRGRLLKSQAEESGCYVEAEDLPPASLSTIFFHQNETGVSPEAVFTYGNHELTTPIYDIIFNDAGNIISLYDRQCKKEVIEPGQAANVLQMFEDKPLACDAWDIDIFYQEKYRVIDNLVETKLIENGALQATVRRTYRYMDTTIVQDMVVYANDRRIDFNTFVDFHERHQLMKAAFPVAIRSTYATYDVQYGNVRRPNHWNTSWDYARFECVGHRFADLSQFDYGVSLLNNCKYGYDIKDNLMRLTLIKSATEPDYDQDQGEHRFTYSLYPHEGDFLKGNTVQAAYALNQPIQAAAGESLWSSSFIRLDCDLVELDAVKVSEDKQHIIVRFHEYAGGSHRVTVSPGFNHKGWAECSLMEEAAGEFNGITDAVLTVKPYEIKTVAFKL